MIKYDIIQSGSDGNCIIVNDYLMLDCGVSYSKIKNKLSNVKIIFISHSHFDHLKPSTIKKIAYEKPNIKFLVGFYLVKTLVDLGVDKKNIFVLDLDKWYNLGKFKAKMQYLFHDVPNNCLHVEFNTGEKLFYAVDTSQINHIEAKNYDLYLIENNFQEEILDKHIQECVDNNDDENKLYYLRRALNTHLSKSKCDDFLINNMGKNSIYQYVHLSNYNNTENGEILTK